MLSPYIPFPPPVLQTNDASAMSLCIKTTKCLQPEFGLEPKSGVMSLGHCDWRKRGSIFNYIFTFLLLFDMLLIVREASDKWKAIVFAESL